VFPVCNAIWKHGYFRGATLSNFALVALRPHAPEHPKGTADQAQYGKEQDFLLILHGWNIKTIEQAIGDNGPDKEGGKIQWYCQVADSAGELA
jgi:hypothetical protein